MTTEHIVDARKGDNDQVILNAPLGIFRQLERIVRASLHSDPIIRDVDEEIVLRLIGILEAKTQEGPLALARRDLNALSKILTAVAAEDLGDIGVEDADVEALEEQIWRIRVDLSGTAT